MKSLSLGLKFYIAQLLLGITLLAMAALVHFSFQKIKAYFEEDQQTLIKVGVYKDLNAQGLQLGQALRNVYIDPKDEKAKENFRKALKDIKELHGQLNANEALELKVEYQDAILDFEKLANEIDKGVSPVLIKSNTAKWRSLKDKIQQGIKDRTIEAGIAQDNFNKNFNIIYFIILGVVAFSICMVIFLSMFFKKIAEQIKTVITNLKESSSQLETVTNNVSSISHELSNAMISQSSSLQETSESIHEISSMTAFNADKAKESASLSENSLRKAQEGSKIVERMISETHEINQTNDTIMRQVEKSNSEIKDIVKIINEIGVKTKVINEIVFQTKLLSFNASVEAARAGEHGKGFAVVAEEIGNLAAMSGQASLEIAEMLTENAKKVETTLSNSTSQIETILVESKQKVENGVRTATACGEILKDIVHTVHETSKMSDEIAVANQEQTQGISEINKALVQLDLVTNKNTDLSAQSAKTSETLAEQTKGLKEIIQRTASIRL